MSGIFTFRVAICILLTVGSVSTTKSQNYNLSKIVSDFERPYLYVINQTPVGLSDTLMVINTETELVVKTLPVGDRVTDLSVHYGEDRLYISNWQYDTTRVIDLLTLDELTPLHLGINVYKINAGRPGRIYYEQEDQWVRVYTIDTETGSEINWFMAREGDAEVNSTGNYYYRCDNNSSAARITKYDISSDVPVAIANSIQHPFGSRNLIMSRDGSRLFWRGYVYDGDLNQLGYLGEEIYATTLHGELAFSSNKVFNSQTSDVIYNLPLSSSVQAVSGNQEKAFIFDSTSGEILIIQMSDIAGVPGPSLNPVPANSSTIVLPLEELTWDLNSLAVRYEVYFGDDVTSLLNADTNSAEYIGSVLENSIALLDTLVLGQEYYWRVDQVGFTGTTVGDVWSFISAPIVVSPKELKIKAITNHLPISIKLALTSGMASEFWSVTESISWLSVMNGSGMTPDTLEITIDVSGLVKGDYLDSLRFESGRYVFLVPVLLELSKMNISQMVTDYGRPYVYALHPGSGGLDDAFLLFFNTDSNQVERVMPIGSNSTDMTVHYGVDRLYVTNWSREYTRVIDLETQQELPPLELGTDVYKINAGRPGRIYIEEKFQNVHAKIANSETGEIVGEFHFPLREGDADLDPTGTFYYHCENDISDAKIYKYDVTTDVPIRVANSALHPYGSRNLVLSRDGSRLFWRGYAYDSNLNELGQLGEEIYATSVDGKFAFSSNHAFYAPTFEVIYTLSVASTVKAISNDQRNLISFDSLNALFVVEPIKDSLHIVCGDINGDSLVTIEDVASLEAFFYFNCNSIPYPFLTNDLNCDGKIDIADIMYLTGFVNGNGPPPCCGGQW